MTFARWFINEMNEPYTRRDILWTTIGLIFGFIDALVIAYFIMVLS